MTGASTMEGEVMKKVDDNDKFKALDEYLTAWLSSVCRGIGVSTHVVVQRLEFTRESWGDVARTILFKDGIGGSDDREAIVLACNQIVEQMRYEHNLDGRSGKSQYLIEVTWHKDVQASLPVSVP